MKKTDNKFAAGAGNVLCYAADCGICGGRRRKHNACI